MPVRHLQTRRATIVDDGGTVSSPGLTTGVGIDRAPNETCEIAVPEASDLNLSIDDAKILEVAAADGSGEFTIMRPYGKSWGADHEMVKRLEARGLMKFKCDGRAPQTRDYLRTSSITASGRAATGRLCK